jgi:hypothetical protein
MDANFVNTVVEALAVPKEFGRGEKAVLMAPRGWGRVEPRNRTFDSPIRLRSLASLAAYLGQNRDGLDLGKVMVVVDGPTNARVLTGYRESENGDTIRVVHSHAACDDMIGDQLGKWVDYEKFVIWLRTAFIQDQQMTDLLTLLGAISSSNVSESVDNGVAQRVVTQKGLAFKDNTNAKAEWALTGYRTFRELDQPAGLFLLRMRSPGVEAEKPLLSLSEADGSMWAEYAVTQIASYLSENCPATVAVIR